MNSWWVPGGCNCGGFWMIASPSWIGMDWPYHEIFHDSPQPLKLGSMPQQYHHSILYGLGKRACYPEPQALHQIRGGPGLGLPSQSLTWAEYPYRTHTGHVPCTHRVHDCPLGCKGNFTRFLLAGDGRGGMFARRAPSACPARYLCIKYLISSPKFILTWGSPPSRPH